MWEVGALDWGFHQRFREKRPRQNFVQNQYWYYNEHFIKILLQTVQNSVLKQSTEFGTRMSAWVKIQYKNQYNKMYWSVLFSMQLKLQPRTVPNSVLTLVESSTEFYTKLRRNSNIHWIQYWSVHFIVLNFVLNLYPGGYSCTEFCTVFGAEFKWNIRHKISTGSVFDFFTVLFVLTIYSLSSCKFLSISKQIFFVQILHRVK